MSDDVWTKNAPNTDGYYWWRATVTARAEIRYVRNGVVQFAWGLREESYDAAEVVGGEWFGPLKEPDSCPSAPPPAETNP